MPASIPAGSGDPKFQFSLKGVAILPEPVGRGYTPFMKLAAALAMLLVLQESRESWEARARDLEAAMKSADAVDTLHLKDGRKLTGKIEEETPEGVRLKVRFGAVKFSRDDIARIERSPVAEFLAKAAAARGKAPELQALMDWAAKNSLPQGRELAACLLLAVDPANAGAKAAVAAAPAAQLDRDVIQLKDGTRKEGVIASETDDAIVLEIGLRGPKGETMGLGKTVVPKAQILRVERMPDGSRAKARERLAAFSDRSALSTAALEKIRPVPATMFDGRPGLRTESDFFILQTTGNEVLAKETTHALNQMFAAFQRHFAVRRNAGKKVNVHFFVSRNEYDAFQVATMGGAVMNPAFFNSKANHIAAYNRVETAKAEAVRRSILDAEKEIEECREKINREEVRIDKKVKEIKAKVNDLVAQAKRDARGDPKAEAEINRQKKDILDDLKSQETEIRQQLNAERKQLDEIIEKNRGVIGANRATLAAQGRMMYETLFHETFHAFAANYLWAERDDGRLPHWLHEGMATYYERSVIEAGELIHGSVNPAMLELAKRSTVPLEKIVVAGGEDFAVTHPTEIDRSNAHYASAWGLAHYLISKGTSREQFEAYAKASQAGDARRAFEALAGKPLAQLEPEWRTYIVGLK